MELRTGDALEKGIVSALDLACASDAQGWLKAVDVSYFKRELL